MRQMMIGLAAAVAVMAASAAPAMACGGLFGYESPCAPVYTAPVYSNCNCGWGHERLPDPVDNYGAEPYSEHQYYYVNQGPTYTGPGDFAPRPVYREGGYESYHGYPWHYRHVHHYYPHYGYGYVHHHSMRYGYYGAPHHYGYREHVLRRYY
jgi:hypothetical protein